MSTTYVEQAIVKFLKTAPKKWQTYEPDDLTEPEEKALSLLTSAGMVERREHLRIRMMNHSKAGAATITATGECGLLEAIEQFLASLYTEAGWKYAYESWRKEHPESHPFHCERTGTPEWRLTDQGFLAKSDLKTDLKKVLDFVLKRGFFDGRPRWNGDRICLREPVMGSGRLCRFSVVEADTTPAQPDTVNIGNFGPDSESLSEVLEKFFSQSKEPLYCAIDCARRSVAIGAETFVITSETQWDFIRLLISNTKFDKLTPRFEGTKDNKNTVDALRRNLSSKNLKKILTSDRDGYRLHPNVKVLNDGQIGIRKTKI